jgi:hypothetical protein
MTTGPLARIMSVAALCASLGACGSMGGPNVTMADLSYDRSGGATTPVPGPGDNPTLYPDDSDDSAPAAADSGARMQCVPYARAHSAVNIHGDAYTWWAKAAGLYARGSTPVVKSVLVLNGYAKRRAHVAVVSRIISPREIRIDHANWYDDGAVYVNDPVVDVSENNDWTAVKVWNIRNGSWGTKTYQVQGFIGPGPAGSASPLVASYEPARRDPETRSTPVAYHIEPSDDLIARQIVATSPDADLESDSGQ